MWQCTARFHQESESSDSILLYFSKYLHQYFPVELNKEFPNHNNEVACINFVNVKGETIRLLSNRGKFLKQGKFK